ncbi:MAG: T9SS type A sorting domain-containing protein [Flavobacteriales bacterium]|nr:T9SS type A sorting domain-containing protein [Flavobacteriales bacterium]
MKKLVLLSFCILLSYTFTNAQVSVYVVEPQSLSGSLDFTWADPGGGWGTSDLNDPLNSVEDTIVLVDDGTTADSLGCNPLVNDLTGKIAVVYRGACQFGTKAFNAQNAGAVGVIIINNVAGGPVGMAPGSDGANVVIPLVMISKDDGAILRDGMDAGTDIVVFIGNKAGFFNHDLGMAPKDILMPRATANPIFTSLDATEWDVPMGAWIFNFGIDAQTNVVLTADISGADNLSVSSAPIASIASGDSAWAALPTYTAAFYNGLYNIDFTITADSADGFLGDNTFNASVFIDSLISYARIDTSTLLPVSSAHFSLSTPPAVYENCIHYMDSNASRLNVLGLYASASGGAGGSMVGELLETRIYEWNDVFTGMTDPNFPASPWTLNTLTSAFFTYTADLQREMVFIPFTDTIQLVDNQRYLFCAITFNAAEVFMGFDSYYDYDEVIINNDQPVSIVITDADQAALGFGTDVTSSVSVRVELSPTVGSLFNTVISATSDEFCSPACIGFATATPLLGQPPYSYVWDDPGNQTTATATGLCNGTFTVIVTDNSGATDTATVTLSQPSTAPAFTVSATSTVICNGDSSWITATAVPQATYVWSTGDTTATIAVDSVGVYTVTVTNCGGTTSNSITLSAPTTPPVFTVSASQASMCVGDPVTLTVSSVSQGVYIWSTGDTALTTIVTDTGTYWVVVSNCGGVDSSSITLGLPSPPTATITGNDPFCSGTSLTLTAGTEPSATYVWSTGDSTQSLVVTTEGTFTVTVANCGGSDVASVTTAFLAAPSLSVTLSGPTQFCEAPGVDLLLSAFAFGADPFTYVWSNGDNTQFLTLSTPAQSGFYTVTATDACGIAVTDTGSTVVISESPTLVATVTDASDFGASDGAITTVTTGGTAPYAYIWNDLANSTTADLSNLTAGNYNVTVTDANGCTSIVANVVSSLVGIDEVNIGTFNVQPNPSNGKFSVTMSGLYDDEYAFEIRNVLGQIVYSESFNGLTVNTVNLNLSENGKGIYFLTFRNSEGERTEKLIVQ